MCESLDDNRDYCDYTNLGEQDIVNLVNIIQIYKNEKEFIIGEDPPSNIFYGDPPECK